MRVVSGFFRLAVLLTGIGVASSHGAPDDAELMEFFESRIRPVLAQECYECHNSRDKAKGGLVLDHREGLLTGGDLGPTIIPGKPEESVLMEALRHEYDLTMPKAGVKLDPPIIADFEKWIAWGAPDPRDAPPSDEELAADTSWDSILETRKNWWSFQPIQTDGGRTIDQALDDAIADAGLEKSLPAEKRTLVRRLHFVLTGLPPTPEELVLSESETLEEITDRLLASAHFGERWARHWMDWIRYAESHGSEGDPLINNSHLYRDYLIRALNADVPYDQLLTEHVAGDLMDDPRINADLGINESMIATAHLRMVFHGFAPTDALDEKVRFTDDQINVFTKAFQGLTVSCARCHDHKFDAISQADYYALFGIFGSTRPGRKLIDLPETLDAHRDELAAMKPAIRDALAEEWLASLDDFTLPELPEKPPEGMTVLYPWFATGIKGLDWAKQREHWKLQQQWATDLEREAVKSWDFAEPADYHSWYRYGNGLPDRPAVAGEFTLLPEGDSLIGEILPAGIYSHTLSEKHAARLTTPDIDLEGEYELMLETIGGGNASERYVVQNYPRRGTVFKVNRFDPKKGRGDWRWSKHDLAYWKGDRIHIELVTARDAPLLTASEERSWFGIRRAFLVPKASQLPTPAPIFLNPLYEAEGAPVTREDFNSLYRETLSKAITGWRDGTLSDAEACYLDAAMSQKLLPNQAAALPKTAAWVERYRAIERQVVVPTRVPGVDEWLAADQPLYDRGDHKKPLEAVPRRFLDAVDPTPYQTDLSGRIELAANLLRDDNPFTRRVIVNRIWHHVFGKGIVPTTDNFGRMGEKPSHPELLDQLATEFSDTHDWSIKQLVRRLVLTEAFQRSSEPTEGVAEKDPENHLLTHFSLKRLEAEAVRDSLLTVSSTLDRQRFGAPVDGKSVRRSVYVKVIRNRLDPFLSVYDAPVPFSTTGRRSETNVPAQSLTMLNDPFVIQAAQRFAAQTSTAEEGERIPLMWEQALGRHPTEVEIEAASEFIAQLSEQIEQHREAVTTANAELQARRAVRAGLLDPARKALEEAAAGAESDEEPDFGELRHWDFSENAGDLELHGSARWENGSLVFDKKGFAQSKPLKVSLTEKTLIARVQLSDLNQRGGGVMTVQDLAGRTFDAIVYGESGPQRWLSGSDRHVRTSSFNGPEERAAMDQPVTIALTYQPDGTVRGYRDGEPYGSPYHSDGPHEFSKDETEVVFGLRHGTTGGGNRMLAGRVYEAWLFDRALSADEVAAVTFGGRALISPRQVIEALSESDRERLGEIDGEIARRKEALTRLGPPRNPSEVWTDLAHSLFNLKEFIFVY